MIHIRTLMLRPAIEATMEASRSVVNVYELMEGVSVRIGELTSAQQAMIRNVHLGSDTTHDLTPLKQRARG
ncbi:MAG: hypothetical protein CME21_10255 [Gemmatimonadetes bacterium]|nr:hypothetical protein [Gemmatimonadota bacterium]HCK08242.1 hypothetical protein [Candidatus Latescibacterota bacterium]